MNHSNPAGGFPSRTQDGYDHAAATAAAALSHDHTPTQNGSKKRKTSTTAVPGSRGVANLTPEQLAKKRANDREAQRAIRQRTKDTIDTLANRIKELESQQPYQELQKVAQERDRALQEVEELKKKLATITTVIGGAAASNGSAQSSSPGQQQQQQPNLHELAAVTAQQSPLPPLNTAPHQPSSYPPPQASAGVQYEHQQHIHPDLRSPRSATASSPGSTVAGSAYHSDGPGMRWRSPGMEHQHPPTSHYSPTHGVHCSQSHSAPPQTQSPLQQPQSNGDNSRLGLNYVLEPQPKSHSNTTSPPVGHRQHFTSAPSQTHETPTYLQLPNNHRPSCPLDSLLLDFFAGRRQKYNEGLPMSDVAGPEYPYLYALLEPSAVYTSKHCHPLSSLLIDILSKFPYIDALPEKAAVLYIMFLVLRWEICPCKRCFELIPPWARPTKEQVEIPHPAWHDHVPWPIIRTNLTLLNKIKFEDFFIPFTSRLCLNWPYPKSQVLIPGDASRLPQDNPNYDPHAVAMNPVFESHMRDLGNWSLGTQFAADLGELVDESVRITDEGVGMPG